MGIKSGVKASPNGTRKTTEERDCEIDEH